MPGDWNLNHSGELIEDLLGNNREYTKELRDGLRKDSRVRFKYTAIVGALIGFIGLCFCFVPFIPIMVSLWLIAMMIGMILGGVFGMLFSMPLTDSVSVHMKVIDYVDNVIRNTDWKPNNLMEGSVTGDEYVKQHEEVQEEEDDDEDLEEDESEDEDHEEVADKTRS